MLLNYDLKKVKLNKELREKYGLDDSAKYWIIAGMNNRLSYKPYQYIRIFQEPLKKGNVRIEGLDLGFFVPPSGVIRLELCKGECNK